MLDENIEADSKLMELVQDDAFARELYAALCNVNWTHENGAKYSDTFRCNSWIVADLRGRDEGDMVFYWSGGEGVISDRVRTELTRLGWSGVPMTC